MYSAKAITCSIALLFGAAGQSAAQYTPEQVISTFYENLRLVIVGNGGLPANQWVSTSIVGAVAEPDDPGSIFDLANFCPEASPVIASFSRVRHLDAIYERILDGLTGPYRPMTQDYQQAVVVLRGIDGNATSQYLVYQEFRRQFTDAFGAYLAETNEGNRPLLLAKARQIETDWKVLGFKAEVDAALLTISSQEATYGTERQSERLRVLENYRSAGLSGIDISGAAFRAPASEVSPPVGTWSNETGWVKVSFSDVETESTYSASSSQNRGFGGLNLGFVTLAVAGGGNNDNENSVNSVKTFKYTYEIKRVSIRRPWLDGVVFYEPKGWTWKKAANTPEYPLVAAGLDATGTPVQPSNATYDNADIGCPMVPLEFIIARNRSIEATTSKSDFDKITTSGSSGGGGSVFGILGGGSRRSWTTVNVTRSGDDVTFTIESPGIAVIGLISEVLPTLPTPNPQDTWPENAWLEVE